MYYTDYHTHTQLSPDSSAPLSAMAEAAAAAGLSELCVTDHYDLVDIHGAPNGEPLDWAAALEQWEPVRDAFRGRLSLKLGWSWAAPPSIRRRPPGPWTAPPWTSSSAPSTT